MTDTGTRGRTGRRIPMLPRYKRWANQLSFATVPALPEAMSAAVR